MYVPDNAVTRFRVFLDTIEQVYLVSEDMWTGFLGPIDHL